GNYGTSRQVNALRLYDSGNGFRHYWWAADLDAINLSTNFLDGNWHHVATTYDGTTRKIYLDGVQVQSDTPGANGATAANFRIGLTYNAEYFSGTLDEVYIYNNALSAAEVQSLASGAGPQITAFTCNKTNAYEGEGLQLGWTVNTSSVTGTFSYEIKNGATTLSSGSAVSGTFNTVVPDLAGTAQTVTFTLRAIETGGNNVTKTATASVAADPGIPTATGQTGLTVQSGTPLGITLAGTDPNGGTLTYSIVTPPAKGSVSAGTGSARTYTATAGQYGTDSFTFKVNDGKYDSAPVFVRLNILTPPIPPTSVVLDDLTIQPTNVAGDFLSNISSADPNAGEAHTFTLVSGAGSDENANFSISGHQLRAATSFAALTGTAQRIRIRSTDTAGLFVEASFILNVAPKQRSVVINEIHYNSADNTMLNSFIELYNAGTAGVDLSGWRISGGVDYVFPAGTTMAAGAYLLVAEDPATMTSYFGKTALGPWNNAVVVYPDGSKETNGLSNDGATVRLRNSADQIVSEVDYEPRSPWPAEGNGEGSSIELINPNLDESHGSNWAAAKNGGSGAGVTYIPAGSNQWKYLKGLNPPPANWFDRTGFDDSTWLPGTASIGYADGDDATTLTDMQSGYQIVYFRHAFTIPSGGVPSALALRVYVDDGCIVYINGQEIPRRFHILAGTPGHQPPPSQFLISGVTVEDHEAATLGWDSYTIPNAQNYLVEGTNVIAVMGANASLASTDFSFDLELKKGTGEASPGAQNISFAANAAPAIRKVEHTPQTPASTDPIIITAKITDPNGVASASLAYQICTAGNFIPSTLPKTVSGGAFANVATPLAANPAFELPANWTTIPMNDDGLGDDVLGGDGIWTATIPPQANRTLVRYRITVADNTGASARVPYAGDPSLNFACFVYNGVPDYQGTPAADLQKLPVYHFLTRKSDYDQCVAYDANAGQRLAAGASWTFENWECAFVSDGVVYDHVPYRLKGANGRYVASGTGGAGNAKRAFKLQFTKGYDFEARDEKGNKHPSKWSSLVTENCWENRATYTFSLNEMVTFHLLNHLGVPSPLGNWAQFRTVMQTAEQPDAFHGDFWGLMYVHENY
ncbi:MAG TPA: LamG-like jellyroll fold domain-containing protein, partial [Verrucomicrobiales bacterium]|nr:LamG-like jellyroll fold domain-containing protein [Verrucomicrobiales bacterium]